MASLIHRIRSTRRAVEVVEVLARHGFADILDRTGIDRALNRGRAMVGLSSNPAQADDAMSVAMRLRQVMEELGPTFIKLGQVLSTRPDLVTNAFADEFRKLQSSTPSAPFTVIRKRLKEEFGPRWDEDVLQHIDEEPLASASIAQTHRAVLADGTPVILKIIRPGVERTIEADIAVLSDLAELVEGKVQDLGFVPTEVVREFARQIRRELDFEMEGRSIERLRKDFAADPRVNFTQVYWQATTRRVLAMEEVKGTLLSRLTPDQFTPAERLAIVEAGTDAVFRMCLDHGFFHADPHPGNIFACEGGRIYFIDCGMTGFIEPRIRGRLAGLVASVVACDLDRVVRILIDLADADPAIENDRAFRADTWEIVTRFQGASLESLNIAVLLNSIFDTLQRHRMHLPADLAILIKALTTIQGVGEAVAPEFNLVGHVQPLIEKLVRDQYTPSSIRDRTLRSMSDYLELMENIPQELRILAAELRRKKFKLRLQMDDVHDLKVGMVNTGRLVAVAMVLASVILGSSIMTQGRGMLLTVIGIAALVVGIMFCIRVVLMKEK
jgi:ubiquinone biosynthesis protein